MVNPIGLILTVLLYKFAEFLRKRFIILKKLPALLIAGVSLIFVLKIFNISYATYHESASYLTLLLIPATISLGYPLYKNAHMLVIHKRIIYPAFIFATVCAILTTYVTAKICHTDLNIIVSMLPKSVTAPIAIEISKSLGGIPELTAGVVVLTGVFGAILGHKILQIIHIKNNLAIGLSIGAASHILGTSSCIEKGIEKQIFMSTLALVIVGVLTAIITPIFIKFL